MPGDFSRLAPPAFLAAAPGGSAGPAFVVNINEAGGSVVATGSVPF